jgi:isocitrate/isopropylmalate dehydrogenase
MKRICVLPGDGIGPEVVECAMSVLKGATNDLEFVLADIGQAAYEKVGSYLPAETLQLMRSCDSAHRCSRRARELGRDVHSERGVR